MRNGRRGDKLGPQGQKLEANRASAATKEHEMRKALEIGGVAAAAILVAFGIAAIVMGFNGRSTVQDSLKLEQIVGSPDMTPAAIAAEAKEAGLPSTLALPTMDIAGQAINTG